MWLCTGNLPVFYFVLLHDILNQNAIVMKRLLVVFSLLSGYSSFAQVDSSTDKMMNELDKWAPKDKDQHNVVKVFIRKDSSTPIR